MKHLQLQIVDLHQFPAGQSLTVGPWTLTRENFEIALNQVAAGCRNVRLTEAGYFIRGRKSRRRADQWPQHDWRFYYARFLRRIFPAPAWIYTGGHHLAVHFGPPGTGAAGTGPVAAGHEAGPALFRLIEAKLSATCTPPHAS